MTIDDLIGELVRLSVASPHGGGTVVLLKFEGHVEIEGANLGSAQLPRGRTVKSPVVLIQARTAHRPAPKRRLPGRSDRSDGESEGSMDQPDHAEMIRILLYRVIAKKIQLVVATGEPSRPLEHLLRVMDSEKSGLRGLEHDDAVQRISE